jgi:hypothetical protein
MADCEAMLQIFIAILSACLAPLLSGEIGNMQSDHDNLGDVAFKEKLQNVSLYLRHNSISNELCDMILLHYHFQWQKEYSTGEDQNTLLTYLSKPLCAEVSLTLRKNIINAVPMLSKASLSLQQSLAFSLRPQMHSASSVVYSENDPGHSMYFISNGKIKVTVTNQISDLEYFDYLSTFLITRKNAAIGYEYCSGYHFGEYCFISKATLRVDTAFTLISSECYELTEISLWDTLCKLQIEEKYKFIIELYTSVNGIQHTICQMNEYEENSKQPNAISNLYKITSNIVEFAASQFKTFNEDGDTRKRRMSLYSELGFSATDRE